MEKYLIQFMEEDIQNYSLTVMFRGTPCICRQQKYFRKKTILEKKYFRKKYFKKKVFEKKSISEKSITEKNISEKRLKYLVQGVKM